MNQDLHFKEPSKMLEHPNFQNHCCIEVLLRQRSDLLGEQRDHLLSLKMSSVSSTLCPETRNVIRLESVSMKLFI